MTDREPQPIPPQPAGRDEEAHDVLAAEEFAMPGPDEARAAAPVALPADPAGTAPHDVLAAEEFAMPAPLYGVEVSEPPAPKRPGRIRMFPLAGALGVAVLALVRRRRAKRA